MSKETLTWLNTQVLIGCTDNRGTAWHYQATEQGEEPNHYPQFIPVGDVQRRVFNYTAEEAPVYTQVPCTVDDPALAGMDPAGRPYKTVQVPGKKAIYHSTTGHPFGVMSARYERQQFTGLTAAISNIIGDTIGVTSAGVLRQGAVGWIEVGVPETISTPSGVTFRPNLLGASSHDGTLAFTLKRTVRNTVCDNSMAAALAEDGPAYRIRHTKSSTVKVADARAALDIIERLAGDYEKRVEELCATTVTDREWDAFLDAIVPVEGKKEGRGLTLATNKRDSLGTLWAHDDRVAPWRNTAWGVVQAVSTHEHHVATVRNEDRAERNQLRTVGKEYDELDVATLKWLEAATGRDLAAA